ncbi:hypothetical protein K491DRAFT_712957 [Lophiostoma macrostomum CBS 122681]|uniref:Mid2 domain-containing protein n=1 Tax=Lophiostoma macrostomum CBS 122681 TaxID=1314788 RepID=A0A6A6THI5_9PLEO|nr:hypothetical protein K491DRAFT_712957 [Lophiostoma macrostomum CBS 122681]
MAFFAFLLSLFFLLPSLSTAADANATCYGLDGTQLDDTYAPCNTGSGHSGCCATRGAAGSVDICLDNGLCMATNDQYIGTIWQEGCTDATGKDPGCPNICPDATTNFDGLTSVSAWNIQMCDYGSYCCRAVGDHNNCCSNATAPKITTTFLGAFQVATSTATSATTSQDPTSVVATAVSTGQPFTSTSLPSTASTCPKDKSAQVGGAVGGVLSAAILGLLGVIFWMHRREKHQRKMKEHYEEQFGQNFAYRRTIIVESDSRLDLPSSSGEEKGEEST